MPHIRTALLSAALLASLLAAAPGPPAPGDCIVERSGATVTLTWIDDGGKHIIRRDGDWLATPGVGASSYTDTESPAGSDYELRTWRLRDDGTCPDCGTPCAGVFEGPPGTWGARRMPVRIGGT